MADQPVPGHQSPVPSSALAVFVLVTFAITWGITGSYIVVPDIVVGFFGEISGSHPLYFLATWAPAVAGIAVVLIHTGRPGLARFLSRLLLWRASPVWWLFILFGIPLVYMGGSLIRGGPLLAPLPPEGATSLFVLLVIMLFLGPMEEIGWRGVAQPILQRHVAPFWAGAIIGAAWGFWHLPAFYLAGVVYESWSFPPFFIGNVTLAILVTPIFNSGRGSLALPMLFHWQLINPFWPDAQPWDTWILVILAAAITWWKRSEMFSRSGAVTDVVPAGTAARTTLERS